LVSKFRRHIEIVGDHSILEQKDLVSLRQLTWMAAEHLLELSRGPIDQIP
jgi:hypothetical protein